VPERVPDVADEVVSRDRRARVRTALAALPQAHALVLVLRHSGMSYQEVAAALGMPAGSVGTTLRRAEAAVRKELEADESPV
jgi:RNA polymerase sigma-70 factor (ECF subfamily)